MLAAKKDRLLSHFGVLGARNFLIVYHFARRKSFKKYNYERPIHCQKRET